MGTKTRQALRSELTVLRGLRGPAMCHADPEQLRFWQRYTEWRIRQLWPDRNITTTSDQLRALAVRINTGA